ncbi:MAG: toll/interleukin-1 receptor domain-containing protein [Acidobacteriota bacterium]|nr:toll/interleukin-1 receptor domain-containing protein [Acidobacteriota bacterium]
MIREVLSYLPSHVNSWLDERQIRVGEDFHQVLQTAILDETDFVIIFLDRNATASEWVQRELSWALERERELSRVFILPVLLEDVWNEVQPEEFRKRKYLKCFEQTERNVRNLAEELKDELFAWLSTNLSREKGLEEWKKRKMDLLRVALLHNPDWKFRTPKVIADESGLTEEQARKLLDEMGTEIIWGWNDNWGDIVGLRSGDEIRRREAKDIILNRLNDLKWNQISFHRLREKTNRHEWDDNFLRTVVDSFSDIFGHRQFHPNYAPGLYIKT